MNLFACHGPYSGALGEALIEHPLEYSVGPLNNQVIKEIILKADNIIAAWGNPPKGKKSVRITQLYNERIKIVMEFSAKRKILCNGKTENGYPKHGLTWQWDGLNLEEYIL